MPKKKSKVWFKPAQNSIKQNAIFASPRKQYDHSIAEIRDNLLVQEDNVVQINVNALQDEDKQSSSNEMSREKGQWKKETPTIHVQEDNKEAKNGINREEEENRAENCNSSSDTYTFTVPTNIRNFPWHKFGC